jgi:hypothetical protein
MGAHEKVKRLVDSPREVPSLHSALFIAVGGEEWVGGIYHWARFLPEATDFFFQDRGDFS